MSDRFDFPTGRLPEPLARLDEELSSIRHEERPSFAPELEAELAREWRSLQGRRRWPVRELLAAGVAGLLLVGMGVPSARAALVRFAEAVGILEPARVAPPAPAPPPVVVLPAPEDELGAASPGAEASAPSPPWVAPSDEVATLPELPPSATSPELLDRGRAEALILRAYPMSLQRAGVGGVVGVLLWVDTAGAVGFANLGRSSGVPDLDRAALQVAPSLRFEAARRGGRPVGTWVEFDVRFEPRGDALDPDWLGARPAAGGRVEPPGAAPAGGRPASTGVSAEEVLRAALGDEAGWADMGTAGGILAGDVPPGHAPTEWRSRVSRLLLDAAEREPENPAPFLALARIRLRQGMRSEARLLLERGLQRAQRSGGAGSTGLLADLHAERGLLALENWDWARGRGRLPGGALAAGACPDAPPPAAGPDASVRAEVLVAWNYLCPEALEDALLRSFQPMDEGAAVDRTVTLNSLRAAVEADPGHRAANLAILLGLADEGRWEDLLRGARDFVDASGGDPHGLVLEGLALHRLSRSEEAEAAFRAALELLPSPEGRQMRDLTPLLLEPRASAYRRLSRQAQVAWEEDFWRPLDPILATPVNEREVEHLARAAYALLRFGSVSSDPGEVLLRYGHPRTVRVIDDDGGVQVELWDFGPGPDFTFRRVAGAASPVLTAEGRSYLEEIREVVPHRYGNAARPVFALPAQVARFRGQEGGAEDVEVYARVPVAFATGPADSVDVSMVLLGPGGATLSVTRARVPAEEAPVSLRASARAEARGLVLEMYSATTRQAAAIRRTLDPMPLSGEAAASDLVLTRVATPPPDEVRRGAPWMEPLPADRPVAEHVIGAFLEIYGLPPGTARYRLRAELEDRGTGELRDLPIQPVDGEGFRPTWERRPRDGAVTPEFVSVWLGGVAPGRYTLRLLATVPGQGPALVATQDLDRR